jgi:hypothetical protein
LKNRKIPMRSCVGCQVSKNKNELIRIIKTPEGEVVVDATGKKNGRGAYICPSSGCLAKARKTKALSRSLGIEIPEDVFADLERKMLEFETE